MRRRGRAAATLAVPEERAAAAAVAVLGGCCWLLPLLLLLVVLPFGSPPSFGTLTVALALAPPPTTTHRQRRHHPLGRLSASSQRARKAAATTFLGKKHIRPPPPLVESASLTVSFSSLWASPSSASSSTTTSNAAAAGTAGSTFSSSNGKKQQNQQFLLPKTATLRTVGPCLGSGSYGTVHFLTVSTTDGGDDPETTTTTTLVGKRAWTLRELERQQEETAGDHRSSSSSSTKDTTTTPPQQQSSSSSLLRDRAARCRYYWTVERHCLQRLPPHPGLPRYRGVVTATTRRSNDASDATSDDEKSSSSNSNKQNGDEQQQQQWMLFDVLPAPPSAAGLGRQDEEPDTEQQQQQTTTTTTTTTESTATAPSLQDLLERDRLDRRRHREHHLHHTSRALLGRSSNNDSEHTLTATLDCFLEQLLEILVHLHDHKIVHRDVKPGNLLVAPASDGSDGDENKPSRLVLIDFGSAADLATAGLLRANVGVSDTRVSLSPIYAAPEVFFVDPSLPQEACTFDCFSAALLHCQLLFQYLDERTESGFHQQLRDSARYDLDAWLQGALQSKVRPMGLQDALRVLRERPGLWRLLRDLLRPDPARRLTARAALDRWRRIRAAAAAAVEETGTAAVPKETDSYWLDDGPYLAEVLESLEVCPWIDLPTVRALEYVASFDRRQPLGLLLAESDADPSEIVPEDGSDDGSSGGNSPLEQWKQATTGALPGEVFVQGVVPGSQADELGVFSVGDRLQGVGELPLGQGGFEKAVEMLQDQPRSAKFVALHFDRKSVLVGDTTEQMSVGTSGGSSTSSSLSSIPALEGPIQVSDQGAWSITGRRKAQEDAFLLHEVHDTRDRSILLAGVLDGHLGAAASRFAQEELPLAFSTALNLGGDIPVKELLENSWNQVSDSYRSACIAGEECVADYDPKEGALMAYTGGRDAVAGTTACLFALGKQTGHLVALNCGDSRGIVIDANGKLKFQTADHTPETEIERLTLGKDQGLDYSIPKCKFGRWALEVGEYDYAVARSLEGPFATSKGLTSEADCTLLQAEPGTTVVVATDGFWEVIGSDEACKIVHKLKSGRTSAGDTAKALCSRAYEKGSNDNVSVVVLYID